MKADKKVSGFEKMLIDRGYAEALDSPIIDEIQKAVNHFRKLLKCEKFIITGSYGLFLLGLTTKVRDLDVELYKPTEQTLEVLKSLAEPLPPEYPERDNYFRIYFGSIKIDIFIAYEKRRSIELAGDIHVCMPFDIAWYKQRYADFKHWMQLKCIALRFFNESDFNDFTARETAKYK